MRHALTVLPPCTRHVTLKHRNKRAIIDAGGIQLFSELLGGDLGASDVRLRRIAAKVRERTALLR